MKLIQFTRKFDFEPTRDQTRDENRLWFDNEDINGFSIFLYMIISFILHFVVSLRIPETVDENANIIVT